MGDSRKYPYHTSDSFHILTAPVTFGISKMCYPPLPSDFQFKEPPLALEFQRAIHGVVRIFSGIAQ